MIFLTLFKTLEGKSVLVELKNDLQIRGTIASVDQYLNFKLSGVSAVDAERFPQLAAVKDLSVIRYVSIDPTDVDTGLLQDAARRQAMESAKVLTSGGGRR
jgi:U6 snRNA-associated Sm-like protein LSm2